MGRLATAQGELLNVSVALNTRLDVRCDPVKVWLVEFTGSVSTLILVRDHRGKSDFLLAVTVTLNYRIDWTSQVTSTFAISADVAEASCIKVRGLVESDVLPAGVGDGDGKPDPCVSPPSAQTGVVINPISRQVPRSRAVFVMCNFPFLCESTASKCAAVAVVN